MPASRIIFLRHAHTALNAEQKFQGRIDTSLDEQGKKQAQLCADRLASFGPSRVICSPLVRVRETVAPFLSLFPCPLFILPELSERSFGPWEGVHIDEVRLRWPKEFQAWKEGREIPELGIENSFSVARRMGEAIEKHAADMDQGTLLVASHGFSLRMATMWLLGFSPSDPSIVTALDNCHEAHFAFRRNPLVRKESGLISSWILTAYNTAAPGI